jgi:CDGSH-type Zn-finger protein
MSEAVEQKIIVTQNGPYVVSGSIPLSVQTIAANAEGESWEWEQGKTFEGQAVYALCRCGHSGNAPYCDGTHARIGFDGAETAVRAPYAAQQTAIAGPTITLDDARAFCAVGRFCDAVQNSWDATPETDRPDRRELVIHQAMRCPSGRLVARDVATGEAFETVFEPSIGVVEDPTESCSGPLWVRGGVALRSQDGESYESRNRVTLCRCGASKNKPFCDGTHVEVHYKDGIA